jgi:hypothetical protein
MARNRIGVIGVGSAGIQTLAHMLAFSGKEYEVVSIYNPSIPGIGVGESTNESFIHALENGCDFEWTEDMKHLDATVKHCTQWHNWRENDFRTPLLGGAAAIHFNTFKLKDFALPRMKQKWGDRFSELCGNVDSMSQDENHVTLVIDGEEHKFDYVFDCTGFPKEYPEDDYELVEGIHLNHCIAHNKPDEKNNWGYTLHQATKNGWMFGIPLTSRTTYGYMFNDTMTTMEDAKEDFAKTIDVPVENIVEAEFKFRPYYTKKLIDGRIINNGNKAVFFEPMVANSIHLYDIINRYAIDYIICGIEAEDINKDFMIRCGVMLHTFHFHYHKGSNFDSVFWDNVKKDSPKFLEESETWNNFVKLMTEWHYEENSYRNIDNIPHGVTAWHPKAMYRLDKSMGHNYFKEKED